MNAQDQRTRAIELAIHEELVAEACDTNDSKAFYAQKDRRIVAAALRLYAAMVDPQEAFVRQLYYVHDDIKTKDAVLGILQEALRLVDAPAVIESP
jgi:hypothetical protein